MTTEKTFGFKEKLMTAFMLFVLLISGLGAETAFAADNNASGDEKDSGNISDVEIEITDDGTLTIGGSSGMTSETKSGAAWTSFITKYRNFIVGISGIGAVSMILFFIMQLLKLGAASGNPQGRQQAITGLIWSGIAAALLGSVTIIVGFFYSALR